MALADSSHLLSQLLDRLLAQHRAGIVPTFGQLEDLIDLNDRVKRDVECAPAAEAPASPRVVSAIAPAICDVITCRSVATFSVETGRYCNTHADLMERIVCEVRQRLALERAQALGRVS